MCLKRGFHCTWSDLVDSVYTVHTFLPPKKGQPLNNGQNARPQCVYYSEVPLYVYTWSDLVEGCWIEHRDREPCRHRYHRRQTGGRELSHNLRMFCPPRSERPSSRVAVSSLHSS